MALNYITDSDTEATAELMNGLFGELDRKLAILFDGKTFLLTKRTFTSWLPVGKIFKFCNGKTPYLGWITAGDYWTPLVSYNHINYVNAVSGGPTYTLETARGYLTVGLAAAFYPYDSLAVMTKVYDGETYPVLWAQGGVEPERPSTWGVAEICVEGTGLSPLNLPDTYDKYSFFRIHNFTASAVTVTWAAHHSIEVPAWGCKCVRRTAVDGTYEDGYNYFFKARAGDPRIWCHNPSGTTDAHNAAAGNNVCNAWHAAWWATYAEAGWKRGSEWVFKAEVDHAEVQDAGPLNKDCFPGLDGAGAPSGTALFSDLLVHSGVLHAINTTTGERTEKTLSGIAGLSAAGFTVSSGTPSGFPSAITKISHTSDVVAWSCNLLREFDNPWALQAGADAYLGAGQPLAVLAPRLDTATNSLNMSWLDYSTLAAQTSAKDEDYTKTNPSAGGQPAPIVFTSTTVADAKDLRVVSNCGADPSNSYSSYSEIALTFGPRGPVLSWTLNVYHASLGNGTGAYAPPAVFTPADYTLSTGSQTLEVQNSETYHFTGWGSDDASLWTIPRTERQYAVAKNTATEMSAGAYSWFMGNPGILFQPQMFAPGKGEAVGNLDWLYNLPAKNLSSLSQDFMLMRQTSPPFLQADGGYNRQFAVWLPPDGLWQYWRDFSSSWWLANRTRIFSGEYHDTAAAWTGTWTQFKYFWEHVVMPDLATEHYNWLAMRVKRLKTAQILNWLCIRSWRDAESGEAPGATYIHGGFLLNPSTYNYGIFGSPYRARTQLTGWLTTLIADANMAAYYTNLGVTVLDEGDLPTGWTDFRDDDVQDKTDYTLQVDGKVTAISAPDLDVEITGTTLSGVDGTNSYTWLTNANAAAIFHVTGGGSGVTNIDKFRWVEIADVQAVVEALGFRFDHRDVVEPMRLEKVTITDATILEKSFDGTTYTKTGGVSSVTIWNGSAFVAAVVNDTFSDKWTWEVTSPGWAFLPDPDGEWVKATLNTGPYTWPANSNTGGAYGVRMFARKSDYLTARVASCSNIAATDITASSGSDQIVDVASGNTRYYPRANITAIVALTLGESEAAYQSIAYGVTVHNPADWGLPSGRPMAQNLLVQDYATGDRASQILEWQAPYPLHQENFSATGWAQALSRITNGASVIPFDGVNEPTADGYAVEAVAADETTIEGDSAAAFDVLLFCDHSRTLAAS